MDYDVKPRDTRRWAAYLGALPIAALLLAGPVAAPTRGAEPETPQAIAVSAYGYSTCAIRGDGTVACWGGGNPYPGPPSGTFSALSGWCGLRTDGTLACWGRDDPAFTPPDGEFTALAVTMHGCAVRADGTLACWGPNQVGQADPPEGAFASVATGFYHTCGIRIGGSLACWGADFFGESTPPPGEFTAVAAGFEYSCAVRVDHELLCWGNAASGMTAAPDGAFAQVAAGDRHACAIHTDGTLACWGDDEYGQASPPQGAFASVTVGASHAAAVSTSGDVACWGDRNQCKPRPEVTIERLPIWMTSRPRTVHWTGAPIFAPITSYDVSVFERRWNESGSSARRLLTGTTATSATITGRPGFSYTFAIRAHDASGKSSGWTYSNPTTVPLDDRVLTRSGSWTALAGDRFYKSTALRSSTRGARLRLDGLNGVYVIGLVATRCPDCGVIKVTAFGEGPYTRRIDLSAPTRQDRALITVFGDLGFDDSFYGRVEIKVVSSGKRVVIDGVSLISD